MLSNAELAALRNVQATTMRDVAIVKRATQTADGMGGFTETWATAYTTVCRIAPAGSKDVQLLAGRLNEKSAWRITVPQSTDVTEADRIEVGARSFEILQVLDMRTYETARVCLCVER